MKVFGFSLMVRRLVIGFTAAGLLAVAAPAQATVTGSVTPSINNIPGNPNFSYHAATVGWAVGSIRVTYDLYYGPSSTGPWSLFYRDTNTCSNTTYCSTATGYSVCTDGWYRMGAYAAGPGGNAENNGATKLVHVYGSLPALATTANTTALASAYDPSCAQHIQPI